MTQENQTTFLHSQKAQPTAAAKKNPLTAKAKVASRLSTDNRLFSVFVDGASRGNPGPAGAGIAITLDKAYIAQHGFYLGEKTNNQAEYLALALAIFLIKKFCLEEKIATPYVQVKSDSELMVRQMNGHYKVKNPELAQIKSRIELLATGMHCSFSHVMRESNKEADKLANLGIDKKTKIPRDFLNFLQ